MSDTCKVKAGPLPEAVLFHNHEVDLADLNNSAKMAPHSVNSSPMKSLFRTLLCGVCLLISAPLVWAKKKSPPPETPPPTSEVESAPKEARRFFGLLPAKEAPPPPTPPPAVTKKKSPPPTAGKPPAPAVSAKPEKKSGTAPKTPPVVAEEKKPGGFLGLFKRKPEANPTPPPTAQEKPEQEKKPGLLSRIFGGKAKSASDESDSSEIDPADRPQRPANWQEKYIVMEDDVAAYAYGPSQSRDPEDRLPKGMVVAVKRSGKYWSEITTPNGRNFTIGADQIRKARESDFAPPPVIASSAHSGEIVPLPEYDPSPPTNLPETSPQRNLDLPDLLLPPLPPP